jgi:hypothetical protein
MAPAALSKPASAYLKVAARSDAVAEAPDAPGATPAVASVAGEVLMMWSSVPGAVRMGAELH